VIGPSSRGERRRLAGRLRIIVAATRTHVATAIPDSHEAELARVQQITASRDVDFKSCYDACVRRLKK
jgi:hypothetical protein